MLVKTVFVHRAGLSTQELLVWLIDSHFRLQLSYQIWKKKYMEGQLAQGQRKVLQCKAGF